MLAVALDLHQELRTDVLTISLAFKPCVCSKLMMFSLKNSADLVDLEKWPKLHGGIALSPSLVAAPISINANI